MDGYQLALQVGRQFGDDDAVRGQRGAQLVAIIVALGRQFEVEQAPVLGRTLKGAVSLANWARKIAGP